MSNIFTTEQRMKLETYLSNHTLPAGIGTEESACSIAAINLAISGELTDDIPDCMSRVLGNTTILLQDAMPNDMRNSARYKRLLPEMAGTGRAKEKERLEVLMEWMWSTVLPQLQPLADERGFGAEWSNMCHLKTADGVRCAAAHSAADLAARSAGVAARSAADADADLAAAAAAAARSAVYTADSAERTGAPDAAKTFWNRVDPIGVLERMTYLKGDKK